MEKAYDRGSRTSIHSDSFGLGFTGASGQNETISTPDIVTEGLQGSSVTSCVRQRTPSRILSSMNYEPPKQTGSCGEVWVLTRAMFGILLVPILALIGVIAWVFITLYAFFSSPPLALIPLALGIIAIVLFARWERRHSEPPE